MQAILRAYARALRSLSQPGLLWHLVWPTLLAIALWVTVGILFWADATAALLSILQRWPVVGGWLNDGETVRVATGFVINLLLFLLSVPLIFVTAAIIVAVVALPFMLDRVARSDYADLEQRRGGSFAGSVFNALWALLVFLVVAFFTLPLWLVPGLGILLSVGLSAWLNQRCYRYDALMAHADRNEMKAVPRRHRGSLYLLGIGAGVLAFVPVLNLFVPAFTGLAFVHYLLEALRIDRGARPV
ncbi:EI24 domain-containing protein [Uliginosibacterium sp. H1]|uniref:EI24 domain-containing protein n=1 Tax=Uliginosibacterium sp. H1 TaxID=3114757 RepID=UPI002E17A8BF|nr:EI24 domain-containing protein [Uliginosibacterium sp. H1]